MVKQLALLLHTIVIFSANGKLHLPTFLSSHMVLQRGPQSAVLWGNATPGAKITVSPLGGNATAEDDGSWTLRLPPQPASTGHTLKISDGTTTETLEDVAFGDVFLCTGQSNMAFSLNDAFNASAEIADSARYKNLRVATVNVSQSNTPQKDAPSMASNYTWLASGPDAIVPVGGKTFSYLSAVCYFFGRDLYVNLGEKIPIGLVSSSIGGVKIETMGSADALTDDTCGGTKGDAPTTNKTTPAKEPFTGASGLWNAMIYPLLPMRFSGVVVYQGESNEDQPEAYSCMFPALIADWRLKFTLPDLTFLFVQLAGFPWHDYTVLRQAQLSALQLPNVGFATAIDLGDPHSPLSPIHPRAKQEVGKRLALAAQAVHYMDPSVVYEGPALKGVSFLNRQRTSVVLSFEPRTANNLHLAGSASCTDCCNGDTPGTGAHSKPFYYAFQAMVNNGTWIGVQATSVRRAQVTLTSPLPISGIRYAYGGVPDCGLFNGANDDATSNRTEGTHHGIVAPPFRHCVFGQTIDNPGDYLSECLPNASTQDVAGHSLATGLRATIPTYTPSDFIIQGSGRAVTDGLAFGDSMSTSGTIIDSGLVKGVTNIRSRYPLNCDSDRALDFVSMSLRYTARATQNVTALPATLTVNIANADNKVLKPVVTNLALGNFSDSEPGFSSPVLINATGLQVLCAAGIGANPRGRLFVAMTITNNDRPIKVPLDDLSGGFRLTVGWVNAKGLQINPIEVLV